MNLRFQRYQPADLRVWHWANALVINGLLLTVLVRRYFFGVRSNIRMIETKMAASGGTVDHKLAREIANTMVDHFWNWHIFLGYGLAALLLVRVLVALRLRELPPLLALAAFKQYRQKSTKENLHFFAVRLAYVSFYLSVLFMVLSGLAMAFDDELGLSSDFRQSLHEVHEFFQWYFLAFVLLHIVGVVIGELGRHRGIVSAMIGGGSNSSSPSDKQPDFQSRRL